MKIIIDDTPTQDNGSVLTYVEKAINQVVSILSETKQRLYDSDRLAIQLNLVMCRNKLEKLLNMLTSPDSE